MVLVDRIAAWIYWFKDPMVNLTHDSGSFGLMALEVLGSVPRAESVFDETNPTNFQLTVSANDVAGAWSLVN
jgi:hypothetical protein